IPARLLPIESHVSMSQSSELLVHLVTDLVFFDDAGCLCKLCVVLRSYLCREELQHLALAHPPGNFAHGLRKGRPSCFRMLLSWSPLGQHRERTTHNDRN